MSLAAHLPAWLTLPPALLLVGWMLWYWRALGRPQVPDSRRRIRRASLLVMLAGMPFFVQALSFLDAKAQPYSWATTWLLVMFCLALLVLTAGLDLANTVRLGRGKLRPGPGPGS